MTYATADDMIARYDHDELTQIAPGDMQGSIDHSRLNAALDDAASEINSYLATHFTVPLDTVPAIIVSACCDIARYYLYDDQPTDTIVERYKQRRTWLKALSEGKATLGIDSSTAPQSGLNSAASKTAENRVFTRDSLSDF